MKKRDLLIGLYLLTFIFIGGAEYHGDSSFIMFSYYTIVLLNIGNAVRLANKYNKMKER